MFVYVMDQESKELLEKNGFVMIKEDPRNGCWCFENKEMSVVDFSLDCPCVVSDIMSF